MFLERANECQNLKFWVISFTAWHSALPLANGNRVIVIKRQNREGWRGHRILSASHVPGAV